MGRVPISAKLVADLLTTAGANRVLCLDLHAAQIQGFFNIPVDHLYASKEITTHVRSLGIPKDDLVVLSTDEGNVKKSLEVPAGARRPNRRRRQAKKQCDQDRSRPPDRGIGRRQNRRDLRRHDLDGGQPCERGGNRPQARGQEDLRVRHARIAGGSGDQPPARSGARADRRDRQHSADEREGSCRT